MRKRTIYTSLPKYVRLGKRIVVLDYSVLSIYGWAKRRIDEMLGEEVSPAEQRFLQLCKGFRYNLFRQVFFQIDGHNYFLDFLIPDKGIAIEVDGKQHDLPKNKAYDKERDSRFQSIGIRTIRITTEQLKDIDFVRNQLVPKIAGCGKKIVYKTADGISGHQKRIMRAIDVLESCPYGGRVEIQSNSTSFLRAISHDDEPKEGAKDLALLARFYEVKKGKDLKVGTRFVGEGTSMRRAELQWVRRIANKSNRIAATRIEVI